MRKLIYCLLFVLALTSCGHYVDHYTTRKLGGTTTITLEPGQKLIEATWKNNGDLWYLIEPMEDDYVPKTKKFTENSMFGVCEGTVIFIESR